MLFVLVNDICLGQCYLCWSMLFVLVNVICVGRNFLKNRSVIMIKRERSRNGSVTKTEVSLKKVGCLPLRCWEAAVHRLHNFD